MTPLRLDATDRHHRFSANVDGVAARCKREDGRLWKAVGTAYTIWTLIVLLLTFLSVAAHYGIYTYITLLVESDARDPRAAQG